MEKHLFLNSIKGGPTSLARAAKCCLLAITISCLPVSVNGEPWLDTRDVWLRADIERLSQARVIKVPINTWPLMWSSIINDLEAAEDIPKKLQASYNRVLSAGRRASRIGEIRYSAKASAATESQLFRGFGDDSREKGELTLRQTGITNHFAWNLEYTRSVDAADGDNNRYDNSYLGFSVGNWIGSIGRIERWWGPGWQSNLALTNNARPTLGVSLQRNYSEPFNFPVLKWFGPWTTNMFISELDDERVINDAKLVGMTVGFRPFDSLEINLRRTAQWGGDGRPETLSNFFDLLAGAGENCVDSPECIQNQPGNQLGGIDLQWNLPWIDGAIYIQTLGEDEAGGLPAKRARQLGFQYAVSSTLFDGIFFVEYDDTTTPTQEDGRFNILYNHFIYQTGYRYENRSIGATWDNDSQVLTLGAVGSLSNGDRLEIKYSHGEINIDSLDTGVASQHSINSNGSDLSSIAVKWQRPFNWGRIELETRYSAEIVDQFLRQEDGFGISFGLSFQFDR